MSDRTRRKLRQWFILCTPGTLTFVVALWHFGFLESSRAATSRMERLRVEAPAATRAAVATAAESREARPSAPEPKEALPAPAVAEAAKPAPIIKVMASAPPRHVEADEKPIQAPKPPPAAKLTRGNFEHVRNGMTEGQVRGLLGPPARTATKAGLLNGRLYTSTVLTWRQPDAMVTVTLRNEKVTEKNWAHTASAQR